MKISTYDAKGYCSKCNSELVEDGKAYYCPQRRWWNRGHYLGVIGGVGVGGFAVGGFRVIDVPDAEPPWVPATSPPPAACNYETLNSITGNRIVLFKSLKSGGWWDGTAMWPQLVTHWRPL